MEIKAGYRGEGNSYNLEEVEAIISGAGFDTSCAERILETTYEKPNFAYQKLNREELEQVINEMGDLELELECQNAGYKNHKHYLQEKKFKKRKYNSLNFAKGFGLMTFGVITGCYRVPTVLMNFREEKQTRLEEKIFTPINPKTGMLNPHEDNGYYLFGGVSAIIPSAVAQNIAFNLILGVGGPVLAFTLIGITNIASGIYVYKRNKKLKTV